jgi:hypothetical protein
MNVNQDKLIELKVGMRCCLQLKVATLRGGKKNRMKANWRRWKKRKKKTKHQELLIYQ